MIVRVIRLLLLVAGLSLSALAAAPLRPDPEVQPIFDRLYNFDFPGAHKAIDKLIADQPDNPLAYTMRGVTYLFYELDRLRILEADLFKDDRRMSDKKKLRPDLDVKEKLFAALDKAESMAEAQLAKNPNDFNALFALCAAKGARVDYAGMIDRRLLQSLSLAKESHKAALDLLKVRPDFYDANLTIGFSEYFVGSLPFFVRWFVPFDGVEGKKENGFRRMEITAEKALYLGPFARILLSIFYLRDKNYKKCSELLTGLVKDYPGNELLRRELTKINAELAKENGK